MDTRRQRRHSAASLHFVLLTATESEETSCTVHVVVASYRECTRSRFQAPRHHDLGSQAIDARTRKCESPRQHSRGTSSSEIEVAQIMVHLVAAPRRRGKRDEKEDEDNKNTSKRRRSKHCVLVRKYGQLRCPKPLALD